MSDDLQLQKLWRHLWRPIENQYREIRQQVQNPPAHCGPFFHPPLFKLIPSVSIDAPSRVKCGCPIRILIIASTSQFSSTKLVTWRHIHVATLFTATRLRYQHWISNQSHVLLNELVSFPPKKKNVGTFHKLNFVFFFLFYPLHSRFRLI